MIAKMKMAFALIRVVDPLRHLCCCIWSCFIFVCARLQHRLGNLPHSNHDQTTFRRSAPQDFYQVLAHFWSYLMMDRAMMMMLMMIIMTISSALTDCCTFPLQSRRDEWRRRVLPSPSLQLPSSFCWSSSISFQHFPIYNKCLRKKISRYIMRTLHSTEFTIGLCSLYLIAQ